MKEKLIIKNFGPIKDVELELGRLNVLIGEQATGKSTVAKLLAVCRYFSYIVQTELANEYFEEGLSAWGLRGMIKPDSFIYYKCNHYELTVNVEIETRTAYDPEQQKEAEYEIGVFTPNVKSVSNEFAELLNQLKKIKPSNFELLSSSGNWYVPTSFFQNDVASVLDNPFYLPEERGLQSIFSLGKSSIQNISDSLFNQLAKLDFIARQFKSETKIEPLDITYRNVNGNGFIKSNKHDFVSLFNAASGYQSTIPIILLIKYYGELLKRNKTFIIEEPELNLFPEAQNKLIQYLADKTEKNNQLLITTHSPYILTSLNNLIYAYQVGQEHTEEVNKIVGKKYWVNPADVSAYRLMTDGTAKNILDEELKQIDVGELDGISRSINEIWDKIANIEYSTSDES